jgi:hypothetical protein
MWSAQSCTYFGVCVCIYVCIDIYIYIYTYTGCNRRNGPDFGRVFLKSNYTDITQNNYIQSWTVTEILAREKSELLWCLRTVLVGDIILPPYLNWIPMLSLDAAPATLTTAPPHPRQRAYSGRKSMDNYDTCASVFVVLFNGFMSLTSYFDVMYRY